MFFLAWTTGPNLVVILDRFFPCGEEGEASPVPCASRRGPVQEKGLPITRQTKCAQFGHYGPELAHNFVPDSAKHGRPLLTVLEYFKQRLSSDLGLFLVNR